MTNDSVGYDICSYKNENIEPGDIVRIGTGIACKPPQGTYARLASRSSLASEEYIILGGIIDPGYRGEIKVSMQNASKLTGLHLLQANGSPR